MTQSDPPVDAIQPGSTVADVLDMLGTTLAADHATLDRYVGRLGALDQDERARLESAAYTLVEIIDGRLATEAERRAEDRAAEAFLRTLRRWHHCDPAEDDAEEIGRLQAEMHTWMPDRDCRGSCAFGRCSCDDAADEPDDHIGPLAYDDGYTPRG